MNCWNVYGWMLDKAREVSTSTLKDWIWANVNNGQPIPGNISVEACRVVLLERGENGRGYHNT